MTEQLRPELPPLPGRMRPLHVHRGYPVPWFVTWFKDGEPCPRGEGEPDFRVITTEVIVDCVSAQRCWVCGGRMGSFKSFVVGPMCAVNRTCAEPPSHRECAEFSARACPFLTRPLMKRNASKLPDVDPLPGRMIRCNPGVALVWTTRHYFLRNAPGGTLFDIGNPEEVEWYCEGRPATRSEVEHSIDTGLPLLVKAAEGDGTTGLLALESAVRRAMELLPA